MRKVILTILTVATLAACAPGQPREGKFALVAIAYSDGGVNAAKLVEIVPTFEKCDSDRKAFIESLGSPPPGVHGEFSCTELAPPVKAEPDGRAAPAAAPTQHRLPTTSV